MASNRLACHDCHRIVEPDEEVCPYCGSNDLTEDWAGYVVITHPASSEIAEKMEVTEAGEYALKVR
ncbi:DNA-directed RNA polymerase, subunit E'' [Halarchaeum sp. CBA1220]|uniref:Transcription elongation factor Spt4 n=1 Tax=Halarchaeum grantii TaxID=1193105 RepID=A0A830F0S9_9EURY|nr:MULTISPECIES: transcription elongation factor subunit Spt4 [Halarchaeum]QLC33160.1 DNA-directed RNA polymerase, subunit E'' [Halarchaeum sp. CBA1220]GGL28247.1 DNA-directed RNA polymerase subunit E'' [Halarchaeum grantii]